MYLRVQLEKLSQELFHPRNHSAFWSFDLGVELGFVFCSLFGGWYLQVLDGVSQGRGDEVRIDLKLDELTFGIVHVIGAVRTDGSKIH
jgi:hypothetical protein